MHSGFVRSLRKANIRKPALQIIHSICRKYKIGLQSYLKGAKVDARTLKRTRRKPRTSNIKHDCIVAFYCRDDNSRLTAGKKEFKRVKGVKCQNRYLSSSIGLLYEKYISENENSTVSRATFHHLRPKFVLIPKLQNRDMCLCFKCDNYQLLLDALFMRNYTATRDRETILKQISCDWNQFDCANRLCTECNSNLPYDNMRCPSEADRREIIYYQWMKTDAGEGKKSITRCQQCTDNYQTLIEKFEKQTNDMSSHIHRVRHQYKYVKDLKTNLSAEEVLLHFDFSENFAEKLGVMVQSAYYGSHSQVAIHQGVCYLKVNKQNYKYVFVL